MYQYLQTGWVCYLIIICQTEGNERDLVGEVELGMGDVVRLALDAIDYCAICDG